MKPYRALTLSALLAPLVVSGCGIHLHDARSAALAKQTAAEFAKFQESSTNVYSVMLANQRAVEVTLGGLQTELAQASTATFATAAPSYTWEELKDMLAAEQVVDGEASKAAMDKIAEVIKAQPGAQAKLTDAKAVLEDAPTTLQRAYEDQARWEARHVLFRSAIKFLAGNPDGKADRPTIDRLQKEVLDVEVLTDQVDASGRVTTKPVKVSTLLANDAELVKGGQSSELLAKYTYGVFSANSAPGLRITIFSLAMDLAKVQADRAKLEVAYLAAQLDALRVAQRRSSASTRALSRLDSLLQEPPPANIMADQAVLTTVNELRQRAMRLGLAPEDQTRKEKIGGAIREAFLVVGFSAVALVVDRSERVARLPQEDVLNHEYSIRVSAVNAAEREALIARGLQALALYHEGGIKAEDIANFLRAAGVAALAVIGAGVM